MDFSKPFDIDVAVRFAVWFRSGFSVPQQLRIAIHGGETREESAGTGDAMAATLPTRKAA